MNLNKHIYRIKNLMYEQPQINVLYGGDISNTIGKSIELLNYNGEQIGKLFLCKLKTANKVDNEFDLHYDEKLFQTIPINYDNSLFLHSFEVNNKFRGNGYGDKLLDYCHNFVKKTGYDYITLIMDFNNPIAENLYNKRNYNVLSSTPKTKFYFVKV